MSSSSQVRLAYIAETTYGLTPTGGNFETIRYNNEALSGTTVMTQSAEVRSDRQPTGSNLVGIDLGGTIPGNLAPTTWVNDFVEAAMMDTWNVRITTGAATIEVAATGSDYNLTRSVGSYVTDGFAVGDVVELATGFATGNNHAFGEVLTASATVLKVAAKAGLTTGAGSGDEIVYRHAYVEIGSDVTSFSIAKTFQDLTSKALSYRGMVVDSMTMDLQARQDGTVSFAMAGGGPDPYVTDADITTGRTVNAAESQAALNGSNNVGVIVVDGARVGYCVGGFNLQVNNSHTPQNCIGQLPPSAQNSGEASATVGLNAYLSDANFSLHTTKEQGGTLSISMPITTSAGEGFAVSLPAFKPDFPDAASGGKNQQTMINISGTAESTATRNALRIYKVTQA